MKSKILFFAILLCFALQANTQILGYQAVYLSSGYSASYGEYEQLNYVLNKYDAENTLQNNFKDIHIPHGLILQGGYLIGPVQFTAGYSQRKALRSARYSENDQNYGLDVKMNFNDYSGGIGLFGHGKKFIFGIGGEYSYGKMTLSYREDLKADLNKQDFITISKGTSSGVTGYLQLAFGSIGGGGSWIILQPYYTHYFNKIDVAVLNQSINPDTYQTDPSVMNDDFSIFGIKLIFSYAHVFSRG